MKLVSFIDWVNALDPDTYEAMTDKKGWAIVFVCCFFGMWIAANAPVVGSFFNLDIAKVLICILPVTLCAFLISWKDFRQGLTLHQQGTLMLATSGTFQFYLWSLVCYSSQSGAAVMAAFPILLASYHGQFFQTSLQYPYGIVSQLIGIAGAFLIAPESEYYAIIMLGGLMAIAAGLVMGDIERRGSILRKEHSALKAAVDAQLLLDQANEIAEVKDVILEIRGTNHDANNALSGVLFNLQYLLSKTRKVTNQVTDIQLIHELADDISTSVERLRPLLEKGRDIGKHNPYLEKANVTRIIQLAIRLTENKYQHSEVSLSFEPESLKDRSIFIPLLGGELALERIMTNLLFNAAEGDGSRMADRIRVFIIQQQPELLEIRVNDNGPGFKPAQLSNMGNLLTTSKQQGTGLGLYTTKRLVHANHGDICFHNLEEGGASISVQLPLRNNA